MYLVDTNVLSERRKAKSADRGVVSFVDRTEHQIFIPALVIGELRGGIERLHHRSDHVQAAKLERWLDEILETYAERILAFDLTCAETWGRLLGLNEQNPMDKQIAATALVYELTVVTRNTSHFDGTGVSVLNPFTADAKRGPRLI